MSVGRAAAFVRGASPAVRALVDRHHLVFADLPASGPKGLVLKGDVLAFLAKVAAGASAVPAGPALAAKPRPPAATAPPSDADEITFTDAPASNIRQIIAQRLTESKTQIPHAYSRIDVDMTAISAWRKAAMAETGAKFSLNDVIIKAAGVALKAVPAINTTYAGSAGPAAVSPTVDIAVAVASPRGLITPIVTNSNARSVLDIAATVAELAGRARDGKLKPHEFQGGSFSISNLGMFGISTFSAVINPPQTCILAVGTLRPFVRPDNTLSTSMSFTLSFDARAVSDEAASEWLTTFKGLLESPARLL